MDLVAEGNIALMHSARSFNAEYGKFDNPEFGQMRFSSYACKCIRRRMLRCARSSRFIHIPENHFAHWQTINDLEERYGTDISDAAIVRRIGLTKERVGMIRMSRTSHASRIEEFSFEGGRTWEEITPDENAERPDRTAERNNLMAYLRKEMEQLQPRTREMMTKLFLSNKNVTLGDLSKQFGVSKERCRQICARGLQRLRAQIEPKWGTTVGIDMVFAETRTKREDTWREFAHEFLAGVADAVHSGMPQEAIREVA